MDKHICKSQFKFPDEVEKELDDKFSKFMGHVNELVIADCNDRVIILPEVPLDDIKRFLDGLEDVFSEWSVYDQDVGLIGMTGGESALANAIIDSLRKQFIKRSSKGK